MDTPQLSVIIPAYNESARLLDTLERFRTRLQECVPSWEIIVVDDGSEDDTRDIARRVAERDPRVRLIEADHGGKGAAVRRGMLAARGRWCFFADADLSMDLNQLSRFLAADADVTIASREAPGAQRVGEPWSRHVIGRAFNMLVRLAAVPGIHDTQCGYKLFTASAVQQLFPVGRLNGFAFDVELLYLARRAGLRIREVPVTWFYRPGSRVRVKTGLAAFFQIFKIRWNDLRGRYAAVDRGVPPAKMSPVGTHAWAWAAAALALALAIGLSWCIARAPLTLYDGVGPILDSIRAPTVRDMFDGAWYSQGYWRPLRMTQIKVVVDAAPADPTYTFKIIHVVLTWATFLLFAAWIRPASLAEFTAAATALLILAGHHAFFVLFSEAYPINHFLEIVALTLAVALLARGAPRWWKDILAAALLVIGALTLESGLLIGVVAIVCWMVGWRGISIRGVAAVAVVLVAYFVLRFGVLGIPSPGLDERATGWWLTRLEASELVERFGENPLPFYAYNVMSALIGLLFSEPRGGSWLFVQRVLDDDIRPWMVIQVASSVVVTGAMLLALVPALGRWRRRALTDRNRFLLVAFALVAANSVLSFGYVKDETLSVGAAFYAAGAFAALAGLGDRVLERRRGYVAAALVLVCASVLWSNRATSTFFSLQTSAYKVANDWALYSLERELPADWEFEPTRRAFLRLRDRNLSSEVPHPVFTQQRRVEQFFEVQ